MPAAVGSRLDLVVSPSLAFNHLTASQLRISLALPHTPQILFTETYLLGIMQTPLRSD